MATLKEYKCKKCGYTVYANPAGHDLTMMGEVYQFTCRQCREVVDVLAFGVGKKGDEIKCPECGSKDLSSWNPKDGVCPKCGGEFKTTGTIMMAD